MGHRYDAVCDPSSKASVGETSEHYLQGLYEPSLGARGELAGLQRR